IRITEMGFLLLDNKLDKFVPSKKEKVKISFDKKLLQITLSKKSFVEQYLLDEFGQETSPLKYEFSNKSVLSKSANNKDIEKFISKIKQFGGKKLPENWKAFLSELPYRFSPFVRVKNEIIFNLKENDYHLIEIFSKDPKVKPFIRKAEGLSFIVKKHNLKKLQEQFMEYGYKL
ncbi:MAG: hypothetical protein U9N34_08480, partial [Candidatus Cloacimonadota bacterium]|nr:hypothetical protein [Candidatus Cloacimonadota bacterium]